MIQLDKKTGINLKKGSTISLTKEAKRLESICIGLNWGVIENSSLFGLIKSSESVDLDGSVAVFDHDNKFIDLIYFAQLTSKDNAVKHSGDDRVGDTNGDDGFDNEVISVNVPSLNPNIKTLVFFLNSFKRQDFSNIPFSKIRIFEGTAKNVENVIATFNLSAEEQFKGKVSMIMGKLVKGKSDWEFVTLGEAIAAKDIENTVLHIQKNLL